jgi:hypothetical protein
MDERGQIGNIPDIKPKDETEMLGLPIISPEKSEQDRVEILDKLRALKRWNGNIIEERKSSLSEDTKYKVRKNWFAAVLANIQLVVEDSNFKNENLTDRFNEISDKYCTRDFQRRDTTAEDIEEVGDLLQAVINKLEGKTG